LGEDLALAHLLAQGFHCVGRNLRTRQAEIDLLVRRRGVLIAVEVKTRSLHPAPEQLVGDASTLRLRHALLQLAPRLPSRARRLRVDVVAVRLRGTAPPELRHFRGEEFDPPPR
jgi:putative endonuclease